MLEQFPATMQQLMLCSCSGHFTILPIPKGGSRRFVKRAAFCVPAAFYWAVAISRFASALDGIARGLIRDADFVRIVQQDLKTGQHRNKTGKLDYFTTAYFHHPDEFKMELIEGGFPRPSICAIEGPVWTVPEFENAEQQKELMATMRAMENEVTLIGASAHIMGIATKPQ